MDRLARLLFHELADLVPAEREKLFEERQIALELRAEVESLLGFDSENASSLTDCVSNTANDMLRSGDALELSYCGPYRLIRLLGWAAAHDEALAFARKSAEWLLKFQAGKSDKSEASALLSTYLKRHRLLPDPATIRRGAPP